MDYYVKSVIPVIESNYENFTALEKNIADFFMKNEEKVALVERIRQYSGVKDVLLSEDGYLNGSPDRTGIQLDKDSDRWLEINIMRVTPDFISFMNIPLSAGQNMEGNNDILVDEIFMNILYAVYCLLLLPRFMLIKRSRLLMFSFL